MPLFDLADSLPIASTILQFAGNLAQGQATRAAGNFTADQLNVAAGQSQAAAQRAAEEERRHTDLALSALRARAEGGGGDPTVVRLAEDIAGEGEYRALSALYQGDDRAAGMRQAADAKRYEGDQAQAASWLGAASTIFRATPTLRDKYGGSGPKPNPVPSKYRGYMDAY